MSGWEKCRDCHAYPCRCVEIGAPQDPAEAKKFWAYEHARERRTYELVDDGRAIKCLTCGLTSHHPGDVENLWCANCQKGHLK